MIHIVVPLLIVIGGPNSLWFRLIGIDVNHPPKNMRMKFPAGGLASTRSVYIAPTSL